MSTNHDGVKGRGGRTAFTLIELLVVIAIISLLISILLPSLSAARRSGQRVACMASQRSIATGESAYSTDNEEAIIGSPATSGAYLYRKPVAFGPAVQRWDFMGPISHYAGMGLPEANGIVTEITARFNAIRSSPAFLCKSNNFLASKFNSPDGNTPTGRMISYNTVNEQAWIHAESGTAAGFSSDPIGTSWFSGNSGLGRSPGYGPSIGKIGIPSNKVFAGDGARFNDQNQPPDFDLSINAGYAGSFADWGAFSTFSKSWRRSWVAGNGEPPTPAVRTEPRAYAFRHSSGLPTPAAPGGAYKGNFVFHDGHAETLGDLEASNPSIWLPKGMKLNALGEAWPDTIKRYGLTNGMVIGP